MAASLAAPSVATENVAGPARNERLRVIVETDAGGDPDDEQSLVRFLLYANEWDVEGIIANRPVARDRENLNRERTGLGIVRSQLTAYRQCYTNLVQHDPRFPTPEALWSRTVPGYADSTEGVDLIRRAVDDPDPRPVWFCNWGTDHGSAPSNLTRALDRVLTDRGRDGYARFKSRLRLSSADAFGRHTSEIEPSWVLWIDTFRPELAGKRWYHRFSALTAKAGGFDIERDVRTGHGPLGALYPLNTTHPQKEGDSMTFLYLVPTGMNDPNQPGWGSWGGRYGLNETSPGRQFYWASVTDAWNGSTNRDNVLARWAADLQNDFRARLDWCVSDFAHANHPPMAVVNGHAGKDIVRVQAGNSAGQVIPLSADGSSDPDGNSIRCEWWIYGEAGTYRGQQGSIVGANTLTAQLHIPDDLGDAELHVILTVRDEGTPPLASYRRLVISRR